MLCLAYKMQKSMSITLIMCLCDIGSEASDGGTHPGSCTELLCYVVLHSDGEIGVSPWLLQTGHGAA